MAMPIHDVCSLFPPMTPEEFADLKASLAEHGLREPITTHRGLVVDGRNRLKACEELGIEPRFAEWDGDGSLLAFVADKNLARRHLTASQRAAITAVVRERMHAGGNFNIALPTVAQDARARNISPDYVRKAVAIRKKDPEILDRVVSGELTLNPRDSLKFCAAVRKAVDCPRLDDHAILAALVGQRKRPDGRLAGLPRRCRAGHISRPPDEWERLLDLILDVMHNLCPNWNDQDLLLRPATAMHVCWTVREASRRDDLSDRSILGILMNARKHKLIDWKERG